MSFRVVVFTTDASSALVRETLSGLLERLPDCEIMVLERARQRTAVAVAKSQFKNLKIHGWRWIDYQGRNVLSRLAGRRPDAATTMRLPIYVRASATLNDARVTVRRVSDLNGAEMVATLKGWTPDLGLSLSAPLLKPNLYSVPRLGTINLHQGKLPDYRGMPPAFWELSDRAREVGVTVHMVAAGLDTGDILLESAVKIEKFATPAGVRVRLDAIGTRMLVDVAEALRAGTLQARPQLGTGKTYTRPTLGQERALDRRINGVPSARTQVKRAIFSNYARLGTLQKQGRDSVVVLLYHRVSDGFRDNVTIGVERFRDQMAYLSDHHRVVDLKDLLKGAQPQGDGPIVAITFDDGYLDNYEYAAPVLSRFGLPTTFFVSTTIVDQALPFQHDLDMYGFGLPTMSWGQMREMQAAGLSFGAHTANHVNMAKIDDATAERELCESKAKLAAELGVTEAMFAYCFGKRADFTPTRLEQVKALGYVANCSAYGGVNGLTVDRWDIRRQGIDWNFDVAALRARLVGWGKETLV
jgi:peptidoglycan/xylan/chitin deacetylase (PgdA/CDA1 family)